MNISQTDTQELIARIPASLWEDELENVSQKYHKVAAWAAIIFDPIFAITDYFNIPGSWQNVFAIRISVSLITLLTLMLRKRYRLPSYAIVIVPFMLISVQNAYTYSLLGGEDIIGHNLNYMALLIGASMFVLWPLKYSLMAIVISVVATTYFIYLNPAIDINTFLVKGGLLLAAVGVFMIVLIKTRFDLTIREIKARLALKINRDLVHAQNAEIQAKAEEIRLINENLEKMVQQRTLELERKNAALEEYAFINAHKLRSPVASILGLVNLMNKEPLDTGARTIVSHLEQSAGRLDDIVGSITKLIERGSR